jgi:beta-lactam-binding protein with PASTA domain
MDRIKDLYQKIKAFVLTKHFLKHLGLVVLFYFVVIGGTVLYLSAYTNHGQKIKVPNLVVKNVNSIKSQVEELDLTYEILDSIYKPELPEGTILEQDPEPTSKSLIYVKEDRIIRLRVSKKTEMVEMPSLVNKSQRFAEQILENRGLKVRIQFEPTNEADGAVLEQKYKGRAVKEGTRVPIGAYITLIVGRNELGAPVELPNLIGMTIFEARNRLNELGSFVFNPICPDCLTGEDSTRAVISSQTPEFLEGTMIPGGSSITVYATKEASNE